jgi:phenylpropionate dioxygenase-like ring-hydroxylating dioxygenase large terminal subunit
VSYHPFIQFSNKQIFMAIASPVHENSMLNDPVVLDDWHVVARSADVPLGKVIGVRLLGRAIALWRDSEQLMAWQDQCPHRGAKLSLGVVQQGELVCPYHAWAFNHQGHCTKIPAHPDLPIPHRAQVQTYHVQERYDMIWVCLGESKQEIPPFPEWDDSRFQSFLCGPYSVKASGPRLIENFLDISHLPFVHDGTLGEPGYPTIPPYHAEVEAQGIMAKHVTCYLPDERGFGGTMAAYTYCAYRPLTAYLISENLDPCFSVVLWVTPQNVCESLMWFCVAFEKSTSIGLETLQEWQNKIVLEDVPIVESQQPQLLPLDARAELHVASDQLAIAYRQWLTQLGMTFGVMYSTSQS